MIISNIYNRTPKSGILFTDICIGDFFNRHDFMKHWLEVMFYYHYLWGKIEPKRRYEWLRAKRSEGTEGVLDERTEAPLTIYSRTIRIMCCVKVWKYIVTICSLVLHREFLIRCAILVYDFAKQLRYFSKHKKNKYDFHWKRQLFRWINWSRRNDKWKDIEFRVSIELNFWKVRLSKAL